MEINNNSKIDELKSELPCYTFLKDKLLELNKKLDFYDDINSKSTLRQEIKEIRALIREGKFEDKCIQIDDKVKNSRSNDNFSTLSNTCDVELTTRLDTNKSNTSLLEDTFYNCLNTPYISCEEVLNNSQNLESCMNGSLSKNTFALQNQDSVLTKDYIYSDCNGDNFEIKDSSLNFNEDLLKNQLKQYQNMNTNVFFNDNDNVTSIENADSYFSLPFSDCDNLLIEKIAHFDKVTCIYEEKQTNAETSLNKLTKHEEVTQAKQNFNIENNENDCDIFKLSEEICPPYFVSFPNDRLAEVGDIVDISCKLYGQPLPQISWYCNDVIIELNDNEFCQTFKDGEVTLRIKTAKKSHSAIYQCCIVNCEGSASFDVQITILDKIISDNISESDNEVFVDTYECQNSVMNKNFLDSITNDVEYTSNDSIQMNGPKFEKNFDMQNSLCNPKNEVKDIVEIISPILLHRKYANCTDQLDEELLINTKISVHKIDDIAIDNTVVDNSASNINKSKQLKSYIVTKIRNKSCTDILPSIIGKDINIAPSGTFSVLKDSNYEFKDIGGNLNELKKANSVQENLLNYKNDGIYSTFSNARESNSVSDSGFYDFVNGITSKDEFINVQDISNSCIGNSNVDVGILEAMLLRTTNLDLRSRLRARICLLRNHNILPQDDGKINPSRQISNEEGDKPRSSVSREDPVLRKLRLAEDEKQKKLLEFQIKAKEETERRIAEGEMERHQSSISLNTSTSIDLSKSINDFKSLNDSETATNECLKVAIPLVASMTTSYEQKLNNLKKLSETRSVCKANSTPNKTAVPNHARGNLYNILCTPSSNKNRCITTSKGMSLERSATSIKQKLLDWCKTIVADYPVEVTNFSTSWSDGLAFCALIHHFYPNSFDFYKLDANNRAHNFQLAFDTAESEAGIDQLLEVEDMLNMQVPDWKCVFTYVQTFYRRFAITKSGKIP